MKPNHVLPLCPRTPCAASVFEREYFVSFEEYCGHYNAGPTQDMPIARLAQGKPEMIEARGNSYRIGLKTPILSIAQRTRGDGSNQIGV